MCYLFKLILSPWIELRKLIKRLLRHKNNRTDRSPEDLASLGKKVIQYPLSFCICASSGCEHLLIVSTFVIATHWPFLVLLYGARGILMLSCRDKTSNQEEISGAVPKGQTRCLLLVRQKQ